MKNLMRLSCYLLVISMLLFGTWVLAQDDPDIPLQPESISTLTATPTRVPSTVERTATQTQVPIIIPTLTLIPVTETQIPASMIEGISLTEIPVDPLFLSVVVDSAFIRGEPTLDANPSASAFEGDRLEAIGRNADGTWYEVARPYSETRLGWISIEVIARPNSDIWSLPITSTVGVDGEVPVFDTGYAAFILGESSLRAAPGLRADRVGIVPHSVTIPILARNQDGSSIQVNYNGNVGWIAAFLLRTNVDPLDIPFADGLAEPEFIKVQIPYEIQIAQVNRLESYAQEQYLAAVDISNYWDLIISGVIVPCEQYPPVMEYVYTFEDVRELPELQRIAPRMLEAIDSLNRSRLGVECGVRPLEDVSTARAAAINARLILNNTLFQVENVRDIVDSRRSESLIDANAPASDS